MGVNLPIVLVANKSDLVSEREAKRALSEEMVPVMQEFKEVESCVRCSAKANFNVNEVRPPLRLLISRCSIYVNEQLHIRSYGTKTFWPLIQTPLYDFHQQNLKSAVVAALQRIFFLCDKDQDSLLSPAEIHALQQKCFNKPLPEKDLEELKRVISELTPDAIVPVPANPMETGLTEEGFVLLNKLFAEKCRHETVWHILRKFHYTDSLSLRESFLLPKLDCPPNCSVELSPSGYKFFVDLFSLFDKDNDGALNPNELTSLFRPTPGLSDIFQHGGSVRNEEGNITLQGWLAHWSMETRVDYKTTLKYLAYLGYEDGTGKGTVSALKVTKVRKRKPGPGGMLKGVGREGKGGRVERNVLLCYVVGRQGSGKVVHSKEVLTASDFSAQCFSKSSF